jgi:tetratricopeptide (TPR) repeat protein
MISTKLQLALLVSLATITPIACADLLPEIADLTARIEYGFYAEEPHVIDAAREALARLPIDDSAARYYGALAAFRSAQLRPSGEDVGNLLDDCMQLATPAEHALATASANAEGWILVAACASLGVERGLTAQRRRDQALTNAKLSDHNNPRIALVEAWRISQRPAALPAAQRDLAAERLTVAIEGFGAAGREDDQQPQWGAAEALAQLGEICLQRGEVRAARDFIERALLAAPDYRYALSMRAKLQRG